VLDHPLHPYTVGLLHSVPSANRRGARLKQIPGMAPSLLHRPQGCPFHPRCPRASDVCGEPPAPTEPLPGREIRCFHPHLPAEAA
jgi:peptide/nickel transport system ATP-binding protein